MSWTFSFLTISCLLSHGNPFNINDCGDKCDGAREVCGLPPKSLMTVDVTTQAATQPTPPPTAAPKPTLPPIAPGCPDPRFQVNLLQAYSVKQNSYFLFPANMRDDYENRRASLQLELFPAQEYIFGCIVSHDRLAQLKEACPNYKEVVRPLCINRYQYGQTGCQKPWGCIQMQKLMIGDWDTPSYCVGSDVRHIGFMPFKDNGCGTTSPMYEMLRDERANPEFPSYYYTSSEEDRIAVSYPKTPLSYADVAIENPQFKNHFRVWKKIPQGWPSPPLSSGCPDPSYQVNVLQAYGEPHHNYLLFPADLPADFNNYRSRFLYNVPPNSDYSIGCIGSVDRLEELMRACPNYREGVRPLCFRHEQYSTYTSCGQPYGCLFMQKLTYAEWGTPCDVALKGSRLIGYLPIKPNWCNSPSKRLYELLRSETRNKDFPSYYYPSDETEKSSKTTRDDLWKYDETPLLFYVWMK